MASNPRRPRARAHALGALPLLLGASVALAATASAVAASAPDELAIDFTDGYTIGADKPAPNYPAGENGWQGFTSHYDWDVVDNADFPDSSFASSDPDGASLRFSSWIANTNQYGNINQLISPTITPAGEPGNGAKHNTFEASFTVDSTTGDVQDRLSVEVSLDDGAGSRSGGRVLLLHGPEGLQFAIVGVAYGSDSAADDWTSSYSGFYDATVPHEVRIVTRYVTGAPDRIELYVDGSSTPVLVGDTFEGYHDAADSAAELKRTSALLFRAGRNETTSGAESVVGLPATSALDPADLAALQGQGLLFADISYKSYNTIPTAPPADIPPTPPAASGGAVLDLDVEEVTAGSEVTAVADGMEPGELVGFIHYSTPVFLGYGIANSSGVASLAFTPPASASLGAHTIVATGVSSGNVAVSGYTLLAADSDDEALPPTGSEAALLPVGLGLAAAGALVLVLVARRRATQAALASR